jgi:hypothetical protein
MQKALVEPFGDGLQIPLEGCDQRSLTARELWSALDWLARINGPSARVDRTKYLCAVLADGLVNSLSPKEPTGTVEGPVRHIAGLLYRAAFGALT